MVDKTTSFKKRAEGRRGTSRRTASKLLLKWRSPSLDLSLRLSASTAKGLVIGSGTAPSIWRIRRMAKWKGLRIKRRLAKDEVTMHVENGSKVDVIVVGTLPLHLPSVLVSDLNNCYLVPALSMNIISGSCLMRDGYSFKSKNNGCFYLYE